MRAPVQILHDYLCRRVGQATNPDFSDDFLSEWESDLKTADFPQTYPGKEEVLKALQQTMTAEERSSISENDLAGAIENLLDASYYSALLPFYSERLRKELLPNAGYWDVEVDPKAYEWKEYLGSLLYERALERLWRTGQSIDEAVDGIRNSSDFLPGNTEEGGLNLEIAPPEEIRKILIDRAVHYWHGEERTPEMVAAIIAAGRESDLKIEPLLVRHDEKIVDDYLYTRLGLVPVTDYVLQENTFIRTPIRPVLEFLRSYKGIKQAVDEVVKTIRPEERAEYLGIFELQMTMMERIKELVGQAAMAYLQPYFSNALRKEIRQFEDDWGEDLDIRKLEESEYLRSILNECELKILWREGETLDEVVKALRRDYDRFTVWPEEFGLNLIFCSEESVAKALVKRLRNLHEGEQLTPEMEAALKENR